MKKKNKIPTITGILLLLGGVFAGVVLLKNTQIFKIGANTSAAPRDVRISNISDTSATITWITTDPTNAFISYGKGTNLGSAIGETQDDQKFYTHSITITGLEASTNYYFKIVSDGTDFDNNSVPWQFMTGKPLPINTNSVPISGSVITASGNPSKRSIVYVNIEGYLTSTLTSDNGTFVLQLASVRTPDLNSYTEINPQSTLLDISVLNQTGEMTIAKIFPQAANPVPTLIVGQNQDFRNMEPIEQGSNPGAEVNIPNEDEPESKLDVSGEKMPSATSVTLESISEGEIVSSDKPEFFGEGPVGENIEITVHSETEITGSAVVSTAGTWKWSPPENLSEGIHSITISWTDASGVLRTLTRSFVVQAGELPSYVATPSATPTSTPTSQPTTYPSISPTITPTRTPVPTTTLSPTVKTDQLPESGSLTPTFLLSMMGVGVLFASFYLWKLTEQEV